MGTQLLPLEPGGSGRRAASQLSQGVGGQSELHGRSSFKTWLFGVIRRTAAEQRRRRAVRELALVRWFAALPPGRRPTDDPDEAIALGDEHAKLIEGLQRLPRRQREVLNLVFYHELTIEAASEVMGVSLGTARTHYQRGKRRLRELLSKGTPT